MKRIIALTAVILLLMITCDNQKVVDDSKYYCDAPTGVVATKMSNESIHLTWNEVSGFGYYEISVRTNLDSADTRRHIDTTRDTSYDDFLYYSSPDVTTLYYYVKTHPRKAGYIASDWSYPASVNVR